jgi:hypothetical protein
MRMIVSMKALPHGLMSRNSGRVKWTGSAHCSTKGIAAGVGKRRSTPDKTGCQHAPDCHCTLTAIPRPLNIRAVRGQRGTPCGLCGFPRSPRGNSVQGSAGRNIHRHWKAHSGAMTDLSETAAETEELTHTFSESPRQDPPNRAQPARPEHSEVRQGETASIAESVRSLRLRELRGIRERNRQGGSGK